MKKLGVLLFVSLLSVVAGQAQALIVQLSPQTLYQQADNVLVGRIVSTQPGWNADHSLIVTTVTVAPEMTYKGNSGRGIFELTVPGGDLGSLGLWVEDQPAFRVGEKSLLFLKSDQGYAPTVMGQVQGKYTVENGFLRENWRPVEDFLAECRGELAARPDGGEVGLDLACTWAGLGWTWPSYKIPVVLYANSAGTGDTQGEFTGLQRGAVQWNNVPNCTFAFSAGGTNTRSAPVYDGTNEIVWKPNAGSYIAATYIWYQGSSMVETDWVFNDNYTWSVASTPPPNTMDVWDIFAHEAGHSVGLADLYSSGCSAQTMYGYASYGETLKRDLADQDIAGAQALY